MSGLTYIVDKSGTDRGQIDGDVVSLDTPDGGTFAEPWATFRNWLDKEGLTQEFHESDDYGWEIAQRRACDLDGEAQTGRLEI